MSHGVYCFRNGQTGVLDDNGKRVAEAQEGWLSLLARHLETCGIDPTQCEWMLPDGSRVGVVRTEEGGYNWGGQRVGHSATSTYLTPEDVCEGLLDLLAAELIEESVYVAGRSFVQELRASALPMPRLFVHGPKSVVFNWTNGVYEVCATVSVSNIALMTSSPDRIESSERYSAEALKAALRRIEA